MGPLLGGAQMPLRDWKDSEEQGGENIRLEFGVLLTLSIAALILMISSVALAQPANAHPGGLAADGCHNDRKNGGRHCHRGPKAGQQVRAPRSGETYYPNCDAARRAGAAPVRRGQPGYGRHLDRDNDGIGCE